MRTSLNEQVKTERSVLALGMFDGVHLGHQVLLKKAQVLAKQQGTPLVAGTFTTHPMALIAPERCPPMLTTVEERSRIMEAMGVDVLYAQPFDQQTMNQRPEEYIAELCRRFHPRFIVVGYNFTFGRAGEGNPVLLAALGRVFGFSAQIVPQITLNGREISSTAIRGLLSRGMVARAQDLLGRPYERQGIVSGQAGGKAFLRLTQNGKQNVPEGLYRVLLQADEKTLPATLDLKEEGQGEARLPGDFSTGTEVSLRFLRGKPDDIHDGGCGHAGGQRSGHVCGAHCHHCEK